MLRLFGFKDVSFILHERATAHENPIFLAALTHSLAIALAPDITVNALIAILPLENGAPTKVNLEQIPAHRWAKLEDVG